MKAPPAYPVGTKFAVEGGGVSLILNLIKSLQKVAYADDVKWNVCLPDAWQLTLIAVQNEYHFFLLKLQGEWNQAPACF